MGGRAGSRPMLSRPMLAKLSYCGDASSPWSPTKPRVLAVWRAATAAISNRSQALTPSQWRHRWLRQPLIYRRISQLKECSDRSAVMTLARMRAKKSVLLALRAQGLKPQHFSVREIAVLTEYDLNQHRGRARGRGCGGDCHVAGLRALALRGVHRTLAKREQCNRGTVRR